jgi:hypothetical protein
VHHLASPTHRAMLAAAPIAMALAITACGSSSPGSSRTAVLGSTLHQECTSISGVLSDGPDPDADSVGYAQAQVLPLRQLALTDARLHQDVLRLASAYQAFSSGSGAGGTAAALAVATAENAVNSICPGAAP